MGDGLRLSFVPSDCVYLMPIAVQVPSRCALVTTVTAEPSIAPLCMASLMQ